MLAVVSDVSEAAPRRLPVQCHRNVHTYVDGRFLQAGGHLQEAGLVLARCSRAPSCPKSERSHRSVKRRCFSLHLHV